jgi:hypothetical protein
MVIMAVDEQNVGPAFQAIGQLARGRKPGEARTQNDNSGAASFKGGHCRRPLAVTLKPEQETGADCTRC